MMQPLSVFGISVLLGVVVWGIIGARDIWPALLALFHDREQLSGA